MKTQSLAIFVVVAALTGALSAGEGDTEPGVGLALTGDEAVDFLTTAEVSSKPEDFDDLAITSPRRLELTKGETTLRVIFKDENTLYRGMFKFGDGREVPMVKDSYLHEVAAFELARMLGLDMVPACVERKLFNRKGSLCLWVEGAMTESARKEKGLEPPDRQLFNQQMYTARLFQQLISDQDFSNIRNILVDDDFKVYKVDSSLAFYPESKLIGQLQAPVYSRDFIAALKALDRDELFERLEPWLTRDQLKSLWTRRGKILERADKLVKEHGEDKILY